MSEFDDVTRLLRDRRPEATALELDEIKQRARHRAANHSGRKQSMKSRLAIIATLAFGMVFSVSGVGLAVTGLSGDDNAGVAQYGVTPPTTPPTTPPVATPAPTVTAAPTESPSGGVQGETQTNKPSSSGTAPSTTSTPSSGVKGVKAAAQPTRQVEAGQSNGSLPFTGFAAIPVILIGALLLTAGLVMRRRSADDA